MELRLAGKKAFITGSTQGIGYAIARALAAEEVWVIVNGRTQATVEAAVERLRGEVGGATVTGLAADFGDPAQVSALAPSLEDVDILVNNVGIFEVADFEEISDEQWQRYFDVNVMSGVRMSRQVLPGMLRRGTGRVLFVSSESGVNVPAGMIHYGTTKAAVLALGNGLAKLTRGTEVTVNTVLGGPTWSQGVADAVEGIARAQGADPEQLRAAVMGGTPTSLLQRFIEPSEIAALVAFLASPLSSATNGAVLRADGGVLTTLL